ncbi:GspH/FimT family pseudopilin [Pseudoalteromonas shioyasakiensis]|uniref:GspH/FimT family pseudopilin n=1 Tax=Pseudoalteromonas shioyasakiensis TaxID=1190813 RepID=UPI00211906F6|nr:GspH/FimT family pseudopilin [Pseudoalteromonas shioyasakiensis]MCQ8876531.1 GspH/FimT family pseudopilin [Pseudoalteromonas shioyasakiensis]
MVKKHLGFTLLEVLITITIISILTAVAAPSFIDFIKRDRLVTSSNQLHSVYKLARSEAIKRDQSVQLEASQSQWLVKTQVGTSQETLTTFTPTHQSITVELTTITISNTGELNNTFEYLVTDNDTSTTDFKLCLLQSGQSWIVEGAQTC